MKNRYLPLGVILVLAGLLTYWLQDYVRTLLVPLLYLLWLGGRLIETIPQAGIWALFLFVALIIAAGSLLKRQPAQAKIRRAEPVHQERIEGWIKLIHETKQETYYKWQLAQRLQELTLDALAHDERLTRKQIRQRLQANQLDLPPEIEAYLQASMTSFSHFVAPEQRFIKSKRQASPLDLEPERLIQFLEESLRDRSFTNNQQITDY